MAWMIHAVRRRTVSMLSQTPHPIPPIPQPMHGLLCMYVAATPPQIPSTVPQTSPFSLQHCTICLGYNCKHNSATRSQGASAPAVNDLNTTHNTASHKPKRERNASKLQRLHNKQGDASNSSPPLHAEPNRLPKANQRTPKQADSEHAPNQNKRDHQQVEQRRKTRLYLYLKKK